MGGLAGAILVVALGAAQKRPPETPQEKQLSDSFRGPELFKAIASHATEKTARVAGR